MKEIDYSKRKSAFSDLVGIRGSKDGKVYTLKIAPRHANAHGYCHGGAMFTLADHAFARTVNTKGRSAVAMEMKVNYLSPVKVGDVLEARCRAIKEGKKTTVCIIEVKREKELVAYLTATAFNIVTPAGK